MAYFTLPFTTVNGVNVGMQSKASAIATLNEAFVQQPVNVSIAGVSHDYTLEELGITIDEAATYNDLRTVTGASSLPIAKLVTNPFISVIPSFRVDRSQTIAAMAKVIEASKIEPISASLVIPYLEADPITVNPSETGQELTPEIAADQLIASVRGSTTPPNDFTIKPKTLAPAVHESQLELALTEVNQLLSEPVIVQNESAKEVTTVSTLTLRTMLVTNDDADISFDQTLLEDYLREELALYFFKAPTPKRVDNGKVTSEGKNGVELDLDEAFVTFMNDVARGAKTIQLPTRVSEFATITDGEYPKTDAGLQALIRDFDIEKRGDYRIIVHQLRGGNIRATHKGATSSIPASTYKAFIAYAAMWAEEQGQITLNDETGRGTVDECMYEMLHYSTDFCAFAIQNYMGWARIDEIIAQAGIENTFLGNEDRIADKYTTAQDEYKLYKGLYDETLLNDKHTERLLTRLKQQKWRSGIPGGSTPSVVADKVGFYDGWINDVGIVYGDQADYIIIALSDGGSFWEINDLSRRIYNFFEN